MSGRFLDSYQHMKALSRMIHEQDLRSRLDYRVKYHGIKQRDGDKNSWAFRQAQLQKDCQGNLSPWMKEAWGPPVKVSAVVTFHNCGARVWPKY